MPKFQKICTVQQEGEIWDGPYSATYKDLRRYVQGKSGVWFQGAQLPGPAAILFPSGAIWDCRQRRWYSRWDSRLMFARHPKWRRPIEGNHGRH